MLGFEKKMENTDLSLIRSGQVNRTSRGLNCNRRNGVNSKMEDNKVHTDNLNKGNPDGVGNSPENHQLMNGRTPSPTVTMKGTVVTLKKQINLVQSVAIIVGIIIGSGIFVSPVGILVNVKSVGMSCIMWGMCGFFSGLCALCYAELGACIPQSGGEYVYIKRAFGDFPGFLCLWINFMIIAPVGTAASSLVFATYVLKPVFPDCEPPGVALRLLAALVVCK